MKALITGASSGIGRDMAIYLSELGYDLIIISRDEKRLKEVASKIKTNVEIYATDLSIKENCFKVYEKYKNEDLDVLINNAGFGFFGNTWEIDINKEIEMINLNIVATHLLTKLFLKNMIKRDKGNILNVASSAGFLSGPILNTYYATKNYVAKWTMALYEELRRVNSKINVSCLCPGPVNTNFNKVAGGSFNIKSLSSEYVARYAINKMFDNKLLIVPGFLVKLGIFFNRFIPNKLSLKIIYNIQKKKVSDKNV